MDNKNFHFNGLNKLLVCFITAFFMSCTTTQKSSSVKTPEWSKGAVWYQIFPERFRNGDTANDPTAEEVMGSDTMDWKITSWTSDWYARADWEKKLSDSFYGAVSYRRYGGDLQGVMEKLDYLANLGVTAIYFNPLFEAQSLHKYDASSYHHIDNNFGPDRRGDAELMQNEEKNADSWKWSAADSIFLQLIHQAHQRNIKVIIDGVFNHVGKDFWAFKDVLKNGKNSRFAHWFIIKSWDNPNTPQDEFDYSGWWGHKSLPEFREDKNGLIKDVRQYIWRITKRWMDPDNNGDPSDGVDGWRLDAVPDVSRAFWKDWCTYVRTINPDVYLTAEIWYEAKDYMSNSMFNSAMNYPFAKATVNFFINQKDPLKVSAFADKLSHLLKIYNKNITLSLMTLIDSHDTDRLASMIINPDRPYDNMGSLKDNAEYNVSKPNADARKVQIMIAAFQASFPGAPMIYYGDEAGMWGDDDPDDRKPMLWDDYTYDNETYYSIGKDYPADKVVFDKQLFDTYKTLFSSRKDHSALRFGDFKIRLTDDARQLFGFSREYGNEKVFAYFNKSAAEQTIALNIDKLYTDILGHTVSKNNNGYQLILPAKSAAILVE